MRISEEQYQKWQKSGKKAANKYHNKKVIYDGIKFDSAKEANYYLKFSLMQEAGIIKDLELQKKFILQKGYTINNKKRREIAYYADFCYISTKDDKYHVIDVKSPATAKDKVYRLKKKLFEYKYGIEIEEL
jgi:hypothetical protein